MDAEVFVGRACELLAIPSTSERPADLRRALDYVLDFVGPGFTVERFESGGKPSALIYPGTERRDFHVILNAHLDVVPAPPDQFRPRRDGDRLFARGAQDMKVTGLLAAQVFRELAASLPYPVALQLVTDEEVGGRDGTRHQLDHGVRGRFVIVGETSGLQIVNESKGMLVVRLLATGRLDQRRFIPDAPMVRGTARCPRHWSYATCLDWSTRPDHQRNQEILPQ